MWFRNTRKAWLLSWWLLLRGGRWATDLVQCWCKSRCWNRIWNVCWNRNWRGTSYSLVPGHHQKLQKAILLTSSRTNTIVLLGGQFSQIIWESFAFTVAPFPCSVGSWDRMLHKNYNFLINAHGSCSLCIEVFYKCLCER